MFFQRIFTSSLGINSYLLGDEKSKQCVVIDPTRHVVPYIIQAQNGGLDITDILETHVHADFVSGAKELKHQLNEKPLIYASGLGGKKWIPEYADRVVDKRTQLKIGSIRLEALHTPGHTPEHIAWICYDETRSSDTPWFAFTGDCVFVGSVGRPDLLGKNELPILASQLYHTLFEVLSPLPDFLEIFPLHSEGSLCGKNMKSLSSSTLGYERMFNPYLKKDEENDWINNLLDGLGPIPDYFKRLKKMNLKGPPLLSSLKTIKWDEESDPPELDKLFLLDIRHPEVFANSHIKHSLNIPFSSTFAHWAGWMVPVETPIGLIIENTHLYNEIADQLRLMGFDQNMYVIQFDHEKDSTPFQLASHQMIDVEELFKEQPKFKSLYLLDVRTIEEWNSGHIEGAHHIELNHLENSLNQIPRHQPIVLICRSGHRASLAASLLQKNGFNSLINLRGGIQSWKQSNFPLIIENILNLR